MSARPPDSAVVLFDGLCPLCHGLVRFALERDPRARLRFALLDSPTAARLLASARPDARGLDSVVVVEGARVAGGSAPDVLGRSTAPDAGGPPDAPPHVRNERLRALVRSEAALAIARRLRFPWPLLAALARVVPRRLRDAVYDAVARRRTRWYGRLDACPLPSPEWGERFL